MLPIPVTAYVPVPRPSCPRSGNDMGRRLESQPLPEVHFHPCSTAHSLFHNPLAPPLPTRSSTNHSLARSFNQHCEKLDESQPLPEVHSHPRSTRSTHSLAPRYPRTYVYMYRYVRFAQCWSRTSLKHEPYNWTTANSPYEDSPHNQGGTLFHRRLVLLLRSIDPFPLCM